MLTLLAVSVGLGAVGWLLWLLARRDLGEARQEVHEAHDRARISEGKAAARHASSEADRDARAVAEAQARIAHIEIKALRLDFALTIADRNALCDQLEALGADRSEEMLRSSLDRLQLYGSGKGVRNRDDG